MRMGRALKKLGWERRKGRPVREGRSLPPTWLWWPPRDPTLGLDEGRMADDLPDF